MMAAHAGEPGEAVAMPEHCKEMMGRSEPRGETREPAEEPHLAGTPGG